MKSFRAVKRVTAHRESKACFGWGQSPFPLHVLRPNYIWIDQRDFLDDQPLEKSDRKRIRSRNVRRIILIALGAVIALGAILLIGLQAKLSSRMRSLEMAKFSCAMAEYNSIA